MKTLKTVLLGSAGAAMLFAAGTVAQAADAPKAAVKGKEPVWRCDTAGFIEYPGSDLCFKIGGHVKAWMGGADRKATDGEGVNPYQIRDPGDPDEDRFWMGALGRFNIDIRNATEFGVVRAFMEFEAGDTNSSTGGPANLRHAFIQIGNWLMGKTWSTFRSSAGTPEVFVDAFGAPGDQAVVRVVQLRYTFKAGNGVTVNVAIEDPAFFRNAYAGTGHISDSSNQLPDFVANIQVAGSWGKAQASVAVHQHAGTGFLAPSVNRRPVGWAALLGIALNVPGTMGDVIYLEGTYADGHMGAIDTGAARSISDVAAGGTERISGWALVGGWEHYWSETLRSTLAASHVRNDYHADFHVAGTEIARATSVWGNLVWTLVKGLDVGVEVIWVRNELTSGAKASGVGAAAQAHRQF